VPERRDRLLHIGDVLEERYLLERIIGEGGMGIVFAARHTELGVSVSGPRASSDEPRA
jgi:hypothetical protein